MISGYEATPSPGGLVGRQREINELQGALRDALAGQGRLVMLVGEPGIGKTRTAQVLADCAQGLSAQVLWGRCYEEQGMPPYWPWVQALRPYIREQSPEQLQLLLGVGAADIAEILPEVKAKLPDLPSPPETGSADYARFRLFDAITSFLQAAVQYQPLVLVLDDLHWADRPSLLLLQFIATEMGNSRLLVLGAYRDVELSRQHPLSETLSQLSRESVFRRVALRGLSQEDTGRFLEVTAGVKPTPALVRTIHDHAEGNPFFMGEVIRLLQEQGELSVEGAERQQGIRIPEGVREVIGQRLNRLSTLCNQVLTEASVIGREFTLGQLTSLIEGVSEAQMLDTLDEALTAHVIEEQWQVAGHYQFTHALVQETLLQELTLTRRVRLHARIGEVLEELYGAEAEAHASQLAHHFAQAEPVLGPEKLVTYSLLAGEQALAANAHEEALAHFERALATQQNEPDENTTAELLFGLARSQVGTSERFHQSKAQDTLIKAFNLFLAVGNAQRAIEAAAYPLRSINARSKELIERALELAPAESHNAGKLLSQYGWVLGSSIEQGHEKAMDAFDRALSIARDYQDKLLEMKTLVAAGHVDAFHLRYDECLRKDSRAIELASEVSEPLEESHAHYELAQVLYCMGDLDRATKHAEAMLRPAERSGHRYRLANAHAIRGTVYALKGDWGRAKSCLERALEISPRDCLTLEELAILEFQQGNAESGENYVERLLAAFGQAAGSNQRQYQTSIAMMFSILSKLTGEKAGLGKAEDLAVSVISSSLSNPLGITAARVALGLLAVQNGIVDLAQEQYSSLVHLTGSAHRYCLGFTFDRLLGLLAHTVGDFDKAQNHFEGGLAFCRKGEYLPELAWTCHDYADVLLQNDAGGCREEASSLLDEALSISRNLGMHPLERRVIALYVAVEARVSPIPTHPDGLSRREVEVLSLIAQGKSNREVSEGLQLSLRTVAHHVTSILNKTNSANRTEAAAYAYRHKLVSLEGE